MSVFWYLPTSLVPTMPHVPPPAMPPIPASVWRAGLGTTAHSHWMIVEIPHVRMGAPVWISTWDTGMFACSIYRSNVSLIC